METAGMKNRYVCQTCGEGVTTVNVDDGTTPFMILCKATKGCKGFMHSSFYDVPQELPAQFEWFKPESLKGYSREMKEHIQKGGLDLREIHPTTTPVNHASLRDENVHIQNVGGGTFREVKRKTRRRYRKPSVDKRKENKS